jgi:hypothetical protein
MSQILEKNNKIAFVYSDHYRVDEYGYIEKKIRLKNNEIIKNHGAGIMFNKKIFKKYGNYNQKITEAEDYEIIDKILKTEKVFYLPLPLYRYYIHKKNISHSGKRHEIIKKLKKISRNV